jgi:hypothetical protein
VKRILFILGIAVVLLSLAAVGWILGLFRRHEPTSGPRRRERLEQQHSLRDARRRARIAGEPVPFPAAFAR